MDDEQVETLFADCMDPEDDEGFIPYSRKYSFNGRASSNVFCAYTICKRRLSIPHVTLCLRTNQKKSPPFCTVHFVPPTRPEKHQQTQKYVYACIHVCVSIPSTLHSKKKKNRPTPECQTYGLCTVIASCLPAVCHRST